MATWDDVADKVKNIGLRSAKGRSNAKHLKKIIQAAKEMGLDPADADQAGLSNLQEIVREGRRAVESQDRRRLKELFRMAAEQHNADLRVALRGDSRPLIRVSRAKGDAKRPIRLSLTDDQYVRIKNAARTMYNFVEE